MINRAWIQRSKLLVWELRRALKRTAGAVTRSMELEGEGHANTLRLQARAEAFAGALLAAKEELKERQGRR